MLAKLKSTIIIAICPNSSGARIRAKKIETTKAIPWLNTFPKKFHANAFILFDFKLSKSVFVSDIRNLE